MGVFKQHWTCSICSSCVVTEHISFNWPSVVCTFKTRKNQKKKKNFFILSSFFLSKKLFNSEHDHHSPSRTVCLQRVNIAFTIPRLFKAADIIKQRILTDDGINFWRKHITWKKWKAKLDAIFKLPCRHVRWTTSVDVCFMVFALLFKVWNLNNWSNKGCCKHHSCNFSLYFPHQIFGDLSAAPLW